MRRLLWSGVAVGGVVGAALWWREHPRFGAAWVNRVVDPWLVRQGVVTGSKGEIGLLEHVGRKSGVVRVTPVHPVRTPDGFRIVVPLGSASQWARNVVSAGHCRLQVEATVHELDEPLLVVPSAVDRLPRPATLVMDWLGFRYLVLRQFAEHAGTLGDPFEAPPPARHAAKGRRAPEAVPVA
jgi:deazaflavin-dependent oxidoreductase (nitroreductase family)